MSEYEPSKVNPADGERFASDLKRIREQKGMTLDDLHEVTKIPLSILSDFELNALLGNPLFNQVYLRSLVRTYAQCMSIDSAAALEGLESATIGMYHGELASEYLESKPEGKRAKRFKRQKPGSGASEPDDDPPRMMAQSAVDRSSSVARGISTASPTGSEGPASSANAGHVLPRSSLFTILSSVGALLVVVVAALLVWQTLDSGDVSDTVAAATLPSPSRILTPQESTFVAAKQPEKPELGDSIALEVAATGGPVRPIRVRVDKDLRRPYWIDRDSVRTFEFRDQIILEENLELVSLSIAGFDYPLGLRPGERVVISRDQVESFYNAMPSR